MIRTNSSVTRTTGRVSNSRRPTPPSAPTPTPPIRADLIGWPTWGIAALLVAALFTAYLPALHGTMLWDDAGHVTRPELRSLAGLFRIWAEPGATQQYYPVLHSAFWLEHQLWGDATVGYHLVNILLHATSAVLFGLLLRRLAIPGAWLAAGLFALHPVAVESVAWISEQKNTLSTVFYLAAALSYLRFADTRRGGAYALASGLFLGALLSKSVTATLPAALLVVAWWQRGRIELRRDVVPLLPWFAVALAAGLHTAWFERTHIGAEGEAFALSFAERLLVAGRAPWFYLGKLLWPADLIFIYPRWTLDAGAWWQWLFPVATAGLLGTLAWFARRSRGPLAAALCFGGALFPALGFFNVFPFVFSFVADHFQYLASLGVYALAAAGVTSLAGRFSRGAVQAGATALLVLLGTLTWRQSHDYRDVTTLYETTLARNPACWMAHQNLAVLLTARGEPAAAVEHLKAALQLHPDYAEAHSNLGDNLTRLGRATEAIPHLQRALELRPDFADARSNLGVAYMTLGRAAEGIAEFERTLREQPKNVRARLNLGLALARTGRTAEALPHFTKAVELAPDNAAAQLNLGIGLLLSGRIEDALPHFRTATELTPDDAETRFSYGRALLQAGRPSSAVDELGASLELRPNFAPAHAELARALQQLGRTDDAQAHAQEAARLRASAPAGR